MRSIRSRLVGSLALAITLSIAAPWSASATVGSYLTMPALVRLSEVIVTGTVVSQASAWSPDHRLIYTRTTVQVTHTYKGDVPSTIVIGTVGGRVGHRVMSAAGTPTFTVGEEAMLFLHVAGDVYFPTALSQGVFHFQSASAGATAARDLSGMTLMASDGTVVASPEPTLHVTDLESTVVRLTGAGS